MSGSVVLTDRGYEQLWNESILSRLSRLFSVMSPNQGVYGQQVAEIQQRAHQVRLVNDLFFQILNHGASVEKVCEALEVLSPADPALLHRLKSSNRLESIRKLDNPPSEKITAFLDFLKEDVGLDLTNQVSVHGCLEALKNREGTGVVNALLIKSSSGGALMIPLQLKVQQGRGEVHLVVAGCEDFKAVLNRARLALVDLGFLKKADDVVCSLELTEPTYFGTSIGLAAAVGAYEAARGVVIDPYTAFTGDINLDQRHWRVQGVSGLPQKLEAARLSGCRRVFIPRENLEEVHSLCEQETLQVIPVDDLPAVFLQLQAPLQPLPGDTLQIRKINSLQAFCHDQGWDLSPPQPIQAGLQFHIAPLHLPEFVITIYTTGTHIPKQHDLQDYQELLRTLQALEEPIVPIRKIEQGFNIQNLSLRREIQTALEGLQPTEQRDDLHCEYAFRFDRGQERLIVKQYKKGTLQIQGMAGEIYKAILECIVPRHNLHYPSAHHSFEALLQPRGAHQVTVGNSVVHSTAVQEIPLPHIGTDESGKGDYFGPMVVAAVLVDTLSKQKLEALGVKDSKLLPDKRCRELAAQIREICQGRYVEVEILPERYNELYQSFRKEGKNLNHLLAWGHARTIESLLERVSCTHAVADQFGDEHYIRLRLMEKGKKLQLIQITKGERYLAVAAASILAREKFLTRLEKLSKDYGVELPKGASEVVVLAAKRIAEEAGSEELTRVAKLHHKTTFKLMEQGAQSNAE
jgi:ribonuclease HIII